MIRRRSLLAGISGALLLPRSGFAASDEMSRIVEAAQAADYVAIGERHDNPAHHAIQAELVAAVEPVGLAFEMIPRAREGTVNTLRAEEASRAALAAALDWEASGWPDFDWYAPILEAAPEARIIGCGLSRADMQRVREGGADAYDPELAARYGVDEPLAEDVAAAMLDEQFAAHCEMLPRAQLGGMVTIQRVWDAAYADGLRRAGESGNGPAVLICGNAHARRDRGAPAMLRHAFPKARIVTVGQIETGDNRPPDSEFDFVVSSPAPARENPCDRMREMMKGRTE